MAETHVAKWVESEVKGCIFYSFVFELVSHGAQAGPDFLNPPASKCCEDRPVPPSPEFVHALERKYLCTQHVFAGSPGGSEEGIRHLELES